MQTMSLLLSPATVVKRQPWVAEAVPAPPPPMQNFIHTVGIPGNTAHKLCFANCGSRASGHLRVAFC